MSRFLSDRKDLVDGMLEKLIPPDNAFPPSIHRAIRYSLMSGGKRIRPILALSANEVVGGNPERMLPFACGIELIHTYSLIHDDLPAMDDSELRRGRPSAHMAFGEPIAILAGDALLTLAFQVMTDPELLNGYQPRSVLEAINVIARAAGLQGMVGGQTVDIETQGNSFDLSLLEYIHTHKTGALIAGSVKAGAILGEATEAEVEALATYGHTIGLAFQIVDDILDVAGCKKDLGKGTGLDSMQDKATYPSLLGLEESRKRAEALIARSEESLARFGEKAETLKEIARYICERVN